MIKRRADILATVLAALLAGMALGAGPATPGTQPAADAAEINRLIKQLGSEVFGEREAAQHALAKIGLPAVPSLHAVVIDEDAERANWARHALAEIAMQPEAAAQLRWDLYPVDDGKGAWGYIDANGRVVIAPVYESVSYFAEGLAAVQVNGRYGFIDMAGKMVITPQFRTAFNFREGLAWIRDDGNDGFIDKTGKIVVRAPGGTSCYEFHEGLAVASPNRIDEGPLNARVAKAGYIDKTGKYAIEPRFDSAEDFHEGLAAVCVERKADDWTSGKWGFIDQTGRMVIPAQYKSVWFFQDGISEVTQGGKAIYIDKTGRRVFEKEFDDGQGFHEGLAGVKIGGKWGFINKTGTVVIEPRFDEISSFFNGRAGIVVSKKHGYIDTEGKVVVEPQYDYGHFFLGELAGVTVGPSRSDGAGTGYVNRAGRVVWPPKPGPATQPAK